MSVAGLLAKDFAAELDYRARHKWYGLFPDVGPLRRELYPKHLQFFAASATQTEICFLAANRVGKTLASGYALTCHLTGRYPEWWVGRRFNHPINAWVAGDTGKTVMDILQVSLLGMPGAQGTGMIPAADVIHATPRTGLPEAVGTVWVQHVSGGRSRLVLKSYDQKRESFQGTKQHVIALDEECPEEIYTECLLRTMATVPGEEDGLIMLTFTPLMGLTRLVKQFVGEDRAANRALIMATWDDVPHLSAESKAKMLAGIPPWQRDARSKGIPDLGAGQIYPVPEADIVVADFPIPAHWPRSYGLDVGWYRTAAIFAATNRDTGVSYLYSEHYRGEAEPVVHAEAIKARGKWIPGVIDPASFGRGQRDGEALISDYKRLGLDLQAADNAVESGLLDTWTALSGGTLKVFASCKNWINEYRMYHRDEKGKIVKEDDHLMDATRYLKKSGLKRAKVEPPKSSKDDDRYDIYSGTGGGGHGGGAGWRA